MKTLMGIILVTLSLFATPAFAACDLSNVTGLDASAKAELRADCLKRLGDAALVKANPVSALGDVGNPEVLSQWGVVAQEWAKALGLAAKELGIAADQFLGTDAGKLTAAVIIWQVAGESLLGFAIGIPLLVLIIVVGLKMGHRATIKSVSYSEKETNWRGKPKVNEIIYFDTDEIASPWVVRVVTLLLSIWIVAGVLF